MPETLEEHQFCDLNGERVFVAHHRPEQSASRAVVMCSPLGEEKLWAHRVFVSLARDLAQAGFAVLRFDFRGEGDSDRQFEDTDLDTRVQDARMAVDRVLEWNPSVMDVTLLGLRLGASIAAAAASGNQRVSRLVLWDPVVDGSQYMQGVLRLNLMYQMALHRKVLENRDALVARLATGGTVNIEGYELAEPLYAQVSAFRLKSVLQQFAGETFVVQIASEPGEPRQELLDLARQLQHCSLAAVEEEPFWKEIRTFYQRAPELTRVTLRSLGVSE